MSNQYLKLRRSAIPGRIPTTSSIDFGEIALNTYDGLAFMKKSGSNGEEVIPIGGSGVATNISGSNYFIPLFSGSSALITSSIYQSGSFTSIRNEYTPEDPNNPEILYVNGNGVNTFNLLSAHGNLNNYVQINVKNYSTGSDASADIVATKDDGNENYGYIDMGINGSQFTNTSFVGHASDAYIYSYSNGNLLIGNAEVGREIIIFNGGFDAAANAKLYIHDQGTIGVNTDTYNTTNPPSLQIAPANSTTYNLIQAKGDTDNYLQMAITNANAGLTASADIVAYNDQDPVNQLAGYIDMGINSSNYAPNPSYPGYADDAYLFTDSDHLLLGSIDPTGSVVLFAGGADFETDGKLVIRANNQHSLTGSLSVSGSITGSLQGTASWAESASWAPSYPISVTGSTIYSVTNGIDIGVSTNNSLALGRNAGASTLGSQYSIFLGAFSGAGASAANNSLFAGTDSGYTATNANDSIFVGNSAGGYSTNAYHSIFLGATAGYNSPESFNSIFIGQGAGQSALSASNSIFLGKSSGYQASEAKYSLSFGYRSGQSAYSASYSILLGYQAGYASLLSNSIGSNNIIIGTGISLPAGRQDSINIGGIIFGTGSYFNPTESTSYAGPADGKIGINKVLPIYNLDVSGSGNFTNGLIVTGSLNAPSITGSLQGTASWAISASWTPISATSSYASSSISSSYAATASYVLNAISSSYATTASYVKNSQTASYVLPLVQNVLITGSVNVSGSINTTGSLSLINGTGTDYIKLFVTSNTPTLQLFRAGIQDAQLSVSPAGRLSSNAPLEATGSIVSTANIRGVGLISSTANYAALDGGVVLGAPAGSSSYVNFTEQGVSFHGALGNIPSSGDLVYKTNPSNTNVFNGTERFRIIKATGNFLIGTAVDSGFMFDVAGTGRFQSNLTVLGNITASSFTGSLQGTASYATIAVSASYWSGSVVSASYAETASSILGNNLLSSSLAVWVTGSLTKLTSSVAYYNSIGGGQFGIGIGGYAPSGVGLYVGGATTGKIRVESSNVRYFDIYHASSEAIIDWSNNTGGVGTRGLNLVYNTITMVKVNQTGLGVKQPLPAYELDVSGSGNFTSNLIVTGSLRVSSSLHSALIATGSAAATTNIIATQTGSYTAGFFDYTVSSGSNARAGTVTAVWNGGTVKYTDNSTTDIGNTNDVTMSVALGSGIVSGFVLLQSTTTTYQWNIKTTYRLI